MEPAPVRTEPAPAPARAGRPWRGWVLRAAASAAVLLAVGALVGGEPLRAGAAVLAPGPVAAAVTLGLLWRALAATRWLLLARALGAPLGWRQAWAEYLRSELLNQVLPGAVLGDVDRARRHGADTGLLPAARGVALERVVGHAVLVVAAAAVLLARPDLRLLGRAVDLRTAAVVAGALVALAVLGLVLWQPWRRTGGRRDATDASVLPAAPGPPVARRALLAALAAGAGLSLGVLACFVGLFVLALRATGGQGGAGDVVPAVVVVLVLAGVPLTVAGWGAREAGAAVCFAAFGLTAADGVSAAVGYGLLSLVSALPGLVPLLLPRLSRASAGPAPAPRRSRGR